MDFRVLRLDLTAALCKHGQGVLTGGKCDHQRVNMQPGWGNIVRLGSVHDIVKDLHAPQRRVWDATVVTEQRHTFPLSVGDDGKNHVDFIPFHGYRVDESRLFAVFHAFNTGPGAWAVHTDRNVGCLLNQVDHPFQGFTFFFFRH